MSEAEAQATAQRARLQASKQPATVGVLLEVAEVLKSATRHLLTEADAAEQFPDGATKVEHSLEVRLVPETDEEREAGSTSAWQRGSPNGPTRG